MKIFQCDGLLLCHSFFYFFYSHCSIQCLHFSAMYTHMHGYVPTCSCIVVSTKWLSFFHQHACILHSSLHILCTMSERSIFLNPLSPLHSTCLSYKTCKITVIVATGNAPLSKHVHHQTQESLLLSWQSTA